MFQDGDKVRVKRLTDVDTKRPDNDEYGLIGKTATFLGYKCDYYDCEIKMDEPIGELGKVYGQPPTFAFSSSDLEKVDE